MVTETELDIPKLRADLKAATAGEWFTDTGDHNALSVMCDYEIICWAENSNPRDELAHIVSAHNAFEALLDRAEQADRYEAALEQIEQMPWPQSESPYALIARAALAQAGEEQS